MIFASPAFLAFAALAFVAALACPARLRWAILLVASYAFYASFRKPVLLAALALVTSGSWAVALATERESDERRRRLLCRLGVALCLTALAGLKYVGFFAGSLNPFAGSGALRSGLTGPVAAVGVSYYTLQAIAYLLDVRDGVVPAERHLGLYALNLAFFPKLLQGPIERAGKLLPQLRESKRPAAADLAAGAQLFLWGMFQKVVVADRLAPFVSAVYGAPRHYQGLPLVLATYLFGAQLYYDFAGYTDMALGVARFFGVRLTQNFNVPYLATSVADFWRRWHISFSSFLLDYIFRPLQLALRDLRTWGNPVALLLTFALSGLWHGPTWSFALWGLIHGVYLATGALFSRTAGRIHKALRLEGSRTLKALQIAATFNLVCLAWVFFRAATPGDAFYIVSRAVTGLPRSLAELAAGQHADTMLFLGESPAEAAFAIALLIAAPLLRGLVAEKPREPAASWRSAWLRTAAYAGMLYCAVFLGSAAQSFVYQQF